MLKKSPEKRIFSKFFVATFFVGIAESAMLPYLVLFLRDLDFSFTQIGFCILLMNVSGVAFEIPTAIVADRISRKLSVLTGIFWLSFAYLMLFFTTQIYAIWALVVVCSLGDTCISGALNAWVIDSIPGENHQQWQKYYFIKSYSFYACGTTVGPIMGMIVLFATDEYRYIWLLGSASFVVAFVVLATVKEYFHPKHVSENDIEQTRLRDMHPIVVPLSLAVCVGCFVYLGHEGWQPALEEIDIPVIFFGYLWAIKGIVGVLAPLLYRLCRVEHIAFCMMLICGQCVALLSFFAVDGSTYILGICVFLLLELFLKLHETVFIDYLHTIATAKNRATVESLKSMLEYIALGVVSLLGGILMDVYSPQAVISLGGVLGLPALLFLSVVKNNSDRNNKEVL